MSETKKEAGTLEQYQLTKDYTEQLPNGTEASIKISLEVSKFSKADFEELLSLFAANSHNFYLRAAEDINNKLL